MRSRHRKKREPDQDTINLTYRVMKVVKDCGLTPRQILDFSGMDKATVSRLLHGKNKTPRLSTLLPILRIAGYRLEIVKLDPKEDKYRSERRFALPPIKPNK